MLQGLEVCFCVFPGGPKQMEGSWVVVLLLFVKDKNWGHDLGRFCNSASLDMCVYFPLNHHIGVALVMVT